MLIPIPSAREKLLSETGDTTNAWFSYFQNIYQEFKVTPEVIKIAVAADFPTTTQVQTALLHCFITAVVTDNNAAKTNTGQTFAIGDYLVWNGTNWTNIGGGAVGSGTVTTVSVVSANGFTGTVATATTTPAITLTTSINALLKGTGTALSAAYAITPKTNGSGSPYSILTSDNTAIFTNAGAAAEVYLTLPAAATGLIYTAYCQNANGIRFVAQAGDTIRIAGAVSAGAGYASSTTTGSSVTLVAINSTEWVSIATNGSWTVI